MLNLNNVTLISVSCDKINQTIKALEISIKNIIFNKIKIFTHEDIKINGIETIKINKLDKNGYNEFIIKELYKYIDTDFVLIIQWDGFILNYNAWDDKFLKYDYIGAPWWLNDEFNVGNGGFSLRSKKLLNFICNLSPLPYNNYIELAGGIGNNFTPEDAIICRYYGKFLKQNGFIFAPENIAINFSIEGNPKFGFLYNNQFGFHGPSVKNMPINFIES